MQRFLAVLLIQVALLAGASFPARAQTPPVAAAPSAESAATLDPKVMRTRLDASRSEIEGVEAALKRPDLSSEDLQALRARVETTAETLREAVSDLEPRLDAAKARLAQLGPKPKDGAPAEGADVARDREEREAAVASLDEINRLARAQLLQSEQLIQQISDRRRSAFTSALFQRSFGALSPQLWMSVASSFPRDLRALQFLLGDAIGRATERSTLPTLTVLGLAVGVGIALYVARRRIAPRLVHRDAGAAGVGPARRLAAAFAVLLVETVPAAAGCLLIYEAVALTDAAPPRLLVVLAALLRGLAFLAFLQGLVDAIFAPDRPAWRLVELPEAHASALMTLGTAFGVAVVIGRVLDGLNTAIAAALPLSVASQATVALVAALALAELLRRLAQDPVADPAEACLGPYIPTGSAVSGPIKLAGWTVTALVVAAALAGYVAFASFLIDQVVWVGSLAGLLYLLLQACRRFVGGTMIEEGRLSATLQTNLGLRRSSLRQVAVLASGILQVILVVVSALLALAPWGIESGDLTTSLRAAFFGFKVGDLTVSLSATAAAIALFAVLMAAAGIVRRWFERTFLPTTQIDAGLQNSVVTAIGYLGFFVAAAAALGYLGLSLERMAIVAGALSVGIGFGLQSIVNNFVSGLILLWERPIRVGDLIVVGDGEGYVRRISVRATEVELLDRSTIIVPNSNFISGTVKNRVRGDATGRVVLPINVLRNQDPARAAEILLAQAGSHPDVVDDPPPRVFFKKIGDTMLELDLICVVRDVSRQARVQSDLNFTVFKALVGESIIPPLGPGAMNVGLNENAQSALDAIADALARAARERESSETEADGGGAGADADGPSRRLAVARR